MKKEEKNAIENKSLVKADQLALEGSLKAGNNQGLQINLEFDFCKRTIIGAYDSRTENIDNKEDKITRLLVAPKKVEESESNAIPISEIAGSIANSLSSVGVDIDSTELQNKINSYEFLRELTVELNQIFIYSESHSDKPEVNNKKEYALSITIEKGHKIDKVEGLGEGFDLKSISINFWDTDRKKVLEQMNMIDIGAYIGELN